MSPLLLPLLALAASLTPASLAQSQAVLELQRTETCPDGGQFHDGNCYCYFWVQPSDKVKLTSDFLQGPN